LTNEEASDRAKAFNIKLLGDQVLEAVQWDGSTSEFIHSTLVFLAPVPVPLPRWLKLA